MNFDSRKLSESLKNENIDVQKLGSAKVGKVLTSEPPKIQIGVCKLKVLAIRICD